MLIMKKYIETDGCMMASATDKQKDSLKDAYYISVNSEYQFLPEFIEDKGIAILGDIGTVLKDLRKAKEESAFV